MPSRKHAHLFTPLAANSRFAKHVGRKSLAELPRKNDLVYGLSGPRSSYEDYSYFVGDTEDEPFVCPTYINNYGVLQGDPDADGVPLEPELKEDLFAFLRAHPKYSVVDAPLTEENVRRKCKGGLDWAAQADSPMKVHFVLDGLDLNTVIDKSHETDRDATAASPKERSVTNAELRWLYRNWDRQHVAERVNFWRKSERSGEARVVPPPWERDYKNYRADDWARYQPRSAPSQLAEEPEPDYD